MPNCLFNGFYGCALLGHPIKIGYFCLLFQYMLTNGHITLTDPIFVKKDKYSAFERFWLKYINDERDFPFVKLSIQLLCIFPTLAIAIYIFSMNPDTPWFV